MATYKRLVVRIGLEDLANADAATGSDEEISCKTVGRGSRAPWASLAKLGAAARSAGEGGTLAAARCLHDHGAITRLGEEVLVAWILVAITSFKTGGRNLIRLARGATG